MPRVFLERANAVIAAAAEVDLPVVVVQGPLGSVYLTLP